MKKTTAKNRILTSARTKQCICMILSILFIYMLVCVPIPVKAAEEETSGKVVRVGSFEDTFNYVNEQGVRKGYGYELLETLAGYTGWKFEYVPCSWEDCFELLQNGEIDLVGDISYQEERTDEMLFSDMPMGEEKYYLYADLNNTDISSTDLKLLNGKKVGVLKGSQPEKMLTEWEQKYGLETEHVNVSGNTDLEKKMASHEIDCFVSLEESIWAGQGISTVSCIGKSDIYFAINKERKDIKEELDSAMHALEEDRPFYSAELYKRYFSINYAPVISKEEKEWLEEHGAIRMGFLNGDPGVSTMNLSSGELSGAISDYIQYAADCLGNYELQFQLVGYDDQKELIQALQENEIDMIFHFNQQLNIAEEYQFACTDTTWTYNLSAVTNQHPFNENESNRVALDKNAYSIKKHIEYYYPQWEIIECDSNAAAAELVDKGEADFLISRSGSTEEYNSKYKFYNVPLSNPEQACFAVNSGNKYLLSVLNKTLKVMPENLLTGSISMYAKESEKVTFADFIKDNLRAVSLICLAAIAIVLLMILGLLRESRRAENVAKKAAEDTRELNEKLRIEAEKAENANKAKTNFLNNMSHDIRTPMNVILGYNQLMKEGLTDPKLLDYQKKIELSGKLLLSIINNVLDMARIESGKMEIDENVERMGDILEEVDSVFASAAKEKNIQIKSEMHVTHRKVVCDGTKIREILSNLVSNALKYTPDGGTVTIKVQELPGDKEGYVKIKTEVADTGIGMSKDYIPLMFDSFSRERNTTIGKVSGTGLGMSIVKRMIDMMGGTIEVESEPGKGSCFTVILQHRIADEICEEKKSNLKQDVSEKILKGKRILLAEDNDLNAEITMTVLEKEGLLIDRVWDGVQCVDQIDQMPAGTYDLILMDIQMPKMDGYQATKQIRQFADKEKAGIPIIAMTANAFQEDVQASLDAGMNAHIAKPVNTQILKETIARYQQA